MYKCNKCGDEKEQLDVRAHTDVDGYTRYETDDRCHFCGGFYDEVEEDDDDTE